jgi:hypothetical protein
MDFHGHPFWWLVTLAVVVWYSTITIYVAVKGTLDIKHMLRTLQARENPADPQACRAPETPHDRHARQTRTNDD